MTQPRNPIAFQRGQRARDALREMLAAHPPLRRPLTIDELRDRLAAQGIYLSPSTIAWHRERIWSEQPLGCNSSDSSGVESRLG